MIKYRHFSGDYLAWFKSGPGQTVHNFSFSDLHPDCLEIRNIQPLPERNAESERTGDYLWFPRLRARKSGLLQAVFPQRSTEIIILTGGETAFSEDIEQVILKEHSGSRMQPESAIRQARHISDRSSYRIMKGRICFSVPMEEAVLPPAAEPAALPPVAALAPPEPVYRAPEPESARTHVPDLVFSNPRPAVPETGYRLPSPGGCLQLYWNLLKWSVYLSLFLALLGWLGNQLKDRSREDVLPEDSENVQTDPPRLNPQQDTLAPMPWDYLSRHRIRWNDFSSMDYLAVYQTSSLEFKRSQSLHTPFANPQVSDAMQYWNAVYTEFYRKDLFKLDSLVDYFRNEQISKNLNSVQTSEMIITFIQEIPYCLIHEGSCSEAKNTGDFMREYHESGRPCLPDIIAGVNSPYEFLHSLKGDCDTRSLLGFALLTRLGIPASVWVSEAYGHSVLGVGLGAGGNYYKMVGGIRHSAVELTAKGFRLGMISPEHGDMNNWVAVLYKNE